MMHATTHEHGLKFQKSHHQCLAHGNPNWTKTTQLPACQGMLPVCHGWPHKEGRWQFGSLTKNQDNWALLEGITQPVCFHCLLWAEFEFLSMCTISWELLPSRCSPVLWKKKKQKTQQSKIWPLIIWSLGCRCTVLLSVKFWDSLWHELHLQATLQLLFYLFSTCH